MANPEHVEIVLQGADAIRKWQAENPDVPLDLSGADLKNSDLIEADLKGANLEGADLSGAMLTGAYLGFANLAGAKLCGALLNIIDFSQANLAGADFTGADLSLEVLLAGANLVGATFTDADTAGIKVDLDALTAVPESEETEAATVEATADSSDISRLDTADLSGGDVDH